MTLEIEHNAFSAERLPGSPIVTERAADPCAVVIFGITGDLAHRKLLPALYRLSTQGSLPAGTAILGVTRRQLEAAEVEGGLRDGVGRSLDGTPFDEAAWKRLASPLELVCGSLDDAATFSSLGQALDRIDRIRGTSGNRIFYLATPPDEFGPILQGLAAAGLVYRPNGTSRPWSRVIVEKPFGRDLESARALNEVIGRSFDESQTFRIDHYLGKETVQNILVFRFANSLFEPIWNRKYIDHVEITAAETLGVEKRGRFYDDAGVVRDIVQNHLLQVMTLCAMEPPVSFAANDIRDEKLAVLRALRPLRVGNPADDVVLGQYRGYREEPGVRPNSRTPTYVAMRLHIDNWRWQGVPFFLRAGKKLARQVTEVSIHFQAVPLCLFPSSSDCQVPEPNVLTLRIQPDEGISLRFETKVPGDHLSVGSVLMHMSYADTFHKHLSDAYERLLIDCMRGDPTLFARRRFVEQSWAFLDPLLQGSDRGTLPLVQYEPGSAGPAEADEWIGCAGKQFTPLKP